MPDTPKNKVKFGLKNVHYATVTFAADGTPTFATPVAIPGAVNLSLSKSSEDTVFYADDGVYFEIGDNSAFDADVELALIPQAFRTAVLGETLDNKGVLVENAEQTRTPFALLFEFAADVNAVRHVLYNCTASQDEVSGQTKAGKIEVQTEKLKLHARPLPKDGKVKAKTGDATDATTYADWYSTVYMTATESAQSGN